MKRIKDLDKSQNLQTVKVKLPKEVYERSSLPRYGLKNQPVYLQGWTMGDFFVKLNPKNSQIYPMFWDSTPQGIEEWEVLD